MSGYLVQSGSDSAEHGEKGSCCKRVVLACSAANVLGAANSRTAQTRNQAW